MKYYKATAPALILSTILVLGGVEPANAEHDLLAGKKIYDQTCVACHGANGNGTIPGAPDFSREHGVLAQSDEILLKHLLKGFQGNGSPMAMPAKGGNEDLTIKDLRNVLRYLHQKFHYKSYN